MSTFKIKCKKFGLNTANSSKFIVNKIKIELKNNNS